MVLLRAFFKERPMTQPNPSPPDPSALLRQMFDAAVALGDLNLGDSVLTGLTLTNVNDSWAILIDKLN